MAVSPLIASFYLCALAIGKDRSLESHSQTLSLLPGITGNYLRTAFYRFALESCHPSATICFGTLFSKVAARIEQNAYIGPHCMLGWVHLQEDVLLGPYVQIPSGPMTHGIARLDVPIRLQPGERKRITIGRDSWIGAGSIVVALLPGVGRASTGTAARDLHLHAYFRGVGRARAGDARIVTEGAEAAVPEAAGVAA